MGIVVKLHGTCGAGKSTIARRFMEEASSVTPYYGSKKKPEAYLLDMGWDKKLVILGPYVSECGGMDALDSDTCVDLVERYGREESWHVFYESMIASGFYGRMGKVSEAWGDNHIFAFMTTPLEECIRRTEQRRRAKGNMKPLDPKNVIWKHEAMLKLYDKLNGPLNRKTVQVATYEDVKALYGQRPSC